MKKYLLIFAILFTALFNFNFINADAAGEFDKTNVPIDRTFTIKFNDLINPASINTSNIYILEENTNKPLSNITFKVLEDKKSVTVTNKDKYYPGTTYELVVSKNVASSTGVALKEDTIMKFTTADAVITPSGKMIVHYINVGQGDSTFIQLATGKNVLIDGGPISAGKDVVAYIKSLGINKIDYVIATHPDADHIGGLIDVLNNFKVSTFINSGKSHTTETYSTLLSLVDSKNIQYIEPKKADIFEYNVVLDSYFQILHANPNATDNNDASLVVRAGLGDTNFMFMGDAGVAIENSLKVTFDTIQADILKAGHHGSNTSSSLAFLQAVKPKATILSYGKDNSYGHPHKEVLTNIATIGAKAYSTAENGTIIVTTDGKTYSITAKPMTLPTPKPDPKPDPGGDPNSGSYVIPGAPTSFKNCTAMREYYPNGVKIGHPAYASKHDRDGDGWACE